MGKKGVKSDGDEKKVVVKVEEEKKVKKNSKKGKQGKKNKCEEPKDSAVEAPQEEDIDIDDLFASAKRTAEERKKEEDEIASKKAKKASAKKKRKAMEVNDADGFSDAKGEKKTNRKMVDGLRVYTYDELGVSAESGGTDDCPFDCDCCF
eukprot:m.36229 g.36229  ORF g.36229 m.36229 type:complete len:150 (-) comp6656_c0_seq1:70-519(-)